MQQSKQAIIWVGKLLLDDRRRGMLDSMRQAVAGNRQQNERGGRATMRDERVTKKLAVRVVHHTAPTYLKIHPVAPIMHLF